MGIVVKDTIISVLLQELIFVLTHTGTIFGIFTHNEERIDDLVLFYGGSRTMTGTSATKYMTV